MRKVIFALLLALTCEVEAQTVMGINIKTTLKSFNQQIIKKGYTPYKTTLGKYEYKVNFAGYPDSNLSVEYNTETDSIWLVEIVFKHESKSKDAEIFKDIREQLIAKYGTPTFEVEKKFADTPAVLARMGYRDASFDNNPYLCWDFDEKNYVNLSYRTGARSKPKKPSYSKDL